MPRVVKHSQAAVSTVRLAGGTASFAAYLTREDFRSNVRGFGVRCLEPGVQIDAAPVGPVEEVLFIVSGIGRIVGREGDLPVEPGDVVLTAPGDVRGIRNTGSEPLIFAGFAVEAGQEADS
jgi:mannose-6-phosphate isomerase-like protein (cupin superfamily)